MSVKKMNPEVKKLWVKALRGGRYKQTRGTLRRTFSRSSTRYCCLGVLCQLYVKNKISDSNWSSETSIVVGKAEYTYINYIPKPIAKWAGIVSKGNHLENSDTYDPKVKIKDDSGKSHIVRLSHLNDNDKFSFKEIADAIEKSL